MTTHTVLRFVIAVGLSVSGCGDDGTAGGGSAASDECVDHEPGTEFAPCESDADCYSGFCDETGNPGPYCWASSSAVDAGRGIACSSDDDCEVPPGAAKGVKGFCGGSNIATNYCSFLCKPGEEEPEPSAGAPGGGL